MAEHAPPSAEEFWEAHYGANEQVWSGRPNAHLVTVVEPLAPGTALDLGAGEGGDALWLAERGWAVTAVDVSATALHRLAARAARAGVAVATERHDLARSFPAGAFDLVSAQFLQSPLDDFPRDAVLRRATRAVAPGGLLLVVAHLTAPPWAWSRPDADGAEPGHGNGHGHGVGHGHGHGHAWRFPTAEETLDGLRLAPDWDDAHWVVERAGAAERTATGPGGETATISDSVLAVRRRP